jgi:hypothetical protein
MDADKSRKPGGLVRAADSAAKRLESIRTRKRGCMHSDCSVYRSEGRRPGARARVSGGRSIIATLNQIT